MDKFDRFQLLHRQFRSHRNPIPVKKLAHTLECSEKTVKRAIDSMRDNLGAPVEYVEAYNGWHYVEKDQDLYELPGLWLTANELQSLALLMQLLSQFGDGLLNQELGVIDKHIEKRLNARGLKRSDFEQHIKVLPLNNRYMTNTVFRQVCEATLKKQQMYLHYTDYENNNSQRTISPQNLVYYRENWYLDAYCHKRQQLRTFSLARIQTIKRRPQAAKIIAPEQLKQHFSKSYGIFAGQASHTAVLRFYPKVAREIALQQWHPEQSGHWQGDDYILRFAYSDERELVQDILRYTPNVKVEEPSSLAKHVQQHLVQGLALYNNND